MLMRIWLAHMPYAQVLKWIAMRWTGQSMPGMGGKATGLRHDEGMAGQSTTSRANHQAPEREAPQALPCPPRHGVFCADPFLFARMWRAYARGWRPRDSKAATDSWLLRDDMLVFA
jgi:hypothetical protein